MFVLIFHDSQKLKLIQLQKELIPIFNTNKNVYAHKPLFVELPFIDDKENPKQAASKIQNIQFTYLDYDEKMIFCNVNLEYDNVLHSVPLPLVHFTSPVTQLQNEEAAIHFPEDFPKKVSIFRIGKKIDLSKYAQAIEDSVWKKIKY